ncbi:DUF924 family protein [Salaquimonas pukyongi]|uniref:DUF924 family protein n=1 Tax=Salaquimonas pukyongi TaxID=2712698 RepID=UPI0012EC2407|nr:DUF924 family protein [Salaquimonas pukyongi]
MSQWKDVLTFWNEAGPEKWFTKDDAFDRELEERFLALNEAAADGKHDDWMNDPQSCLALILVLDQFSRNLFRDSSNAFSRDAKGLEAARHALKKGFPDQVSKDLRFFFYMPFMHSESIADQRTSLCLQHSVQGAGGMKYACEHHEIIARFGRFPHRNPVLGRHTTPAEQAFLDAGGFKG